MKIKSAQATLNELRDGHVLNELAQSIHNAMKAVATFRKPAEITLSITIKPLGNEGVSDAVEFIAEVTEKLPKAKPPSTLFFVDGDGNPSKQRDKQPDLSGLNVVATTANPASLLASFSGGLLGD